MEKNTYLIEEVDETNESTIKPENQDGAVQKPPSFKRILIYLLLIILIGTGLYAYIKINVLEDQLQTALQEKAEVQVTSIRIRDRLLEIGELATAIYEYENTREITNARSVFGWEIPGTKNEVNLYYKGELKMGYDVAAILTEIDRDEKVISVYLPEPKVLENNILLSDLRLYGKNNILNPIDIEDITTYFEGFQEEALEGADYYGIRNKAENRMELLIKNFLGVFSEYTVEFK